MFEGIPSSENNNETSPIEVETKPDHNIFGVMEGENPEQKAISSLADDIGASSVDYESVLERAKLNPEQLTLLKRGANGLEYIEMKKNEPENFSKLEGIHEMVRGIIREMIDEYQGEGIS